MNRQARIYVAGHRGLVGSALVRRMQAHAYTNIITRNHAELDLTDLASVRSFFELERPEYVFLAAAKVGGIQANSTYPAEFIQINLAIQTSVIHAAYLTGARRLVFFGSTCAYPGDCPQPMREEHLGSGYLEPTSEPYAIAKIAGMKMCQAYNRQYGTCFFSLIPATLYGPNDNFDARTSHVLSALLARFHQAKQAGQDSVVVWGSGAPRREFLYVDDLADACIFLMALEENRLRAAFQESGWVLNVGCGEDLTVMELASTIQQVVGFQGQTCTDPSRPDGAARKLLDSSKVRRLGWTPKVPLAEGIQRTYSWYQDRGSKVSDAVPAVL